MENLNQKSWLSENVKSILIVVWFIVLWIIIRILGLIFKWWPLYFILHQFDKNVPYDNNNQTFQNIENNDNFFEEEVDEKDNEINNKVIPFEKKEKCMKYYDSFKKELYEDTYESYSGFFKSLFDYEFFYSRELDSCISAYSIMWREEGHPIYRYQIIDYLNWRKMLFNCSLSPLNYTYWTTEWKENCKDEWEIEKERYKE